MTFGGAEMGDADDLLAAIERIYAAVAAPELWPAAMEGIVELLRAGHAIVLAGGGGVPFVAHARVDERDLARSHAGWRRCGDQLLAAMPQGVATPRSAIVPDREYLRSVHYNEVARPLNGFHALGAWRAAQGEPYVLAVCRPQAAGDFDAAAASTLQRILPHLATALTLRARLHLAEQRSGALIAAFDRLDAPAILVDAAARVSFVNARAAALIAASDGLGADRAGLAGANSTLTRRLRDAVAAVATQPDIAERRLCLPRPSGRPPLLVTLLRTGSTADAARAPWVAVFVKEPDAPVAVSRRMLIDVFRLTAREADVAALVAQGVDLPGIAGRLGLGVGTVRHHLKHVFDKTGMRSQGTLAVLLRGYAEPAG